MLDRTGGIIPAKHKTVISKEKVTNLRGPRSNFNTMNKVGCLGLRYKTRKNISTNNKQVGG
jgi:hypothetical protein